MKQIAAGVLIALSVTFAFPAQAQVGAKKDDEKKVETVKADPRVEKLVQDAGLKYTVDGDGDIRLANNLGEGRSQLVWIPANTFQLGTLEIRQIWSPAYKSRTPLPADIANLLLEKNAKVKLGAWQVTRMGGDYVALFSAQIAADTDTLTLLQTLQAVTDTADEVEKVLSDKDVY